MLLDMSEEADEVLTLLDFCADVACKMVDAYVHADINVIAVVDPMISQISPEHFSQFIAPPSKKIFDHIRAAGALSSLFVCGNATRNLEAMAVTTCDNIFVDENVDLSALSRIARAAGKSFGGNMQLTVVLLLGDENDARRDAVRCIDQAGEGSGFVLAPSCYLPYGVRPANLEAIAALVHDPYQLEVARKLPPADHSDSFDDIIPPDYASESSVIVDVVTLDSAGCAPCAYMLKATQEAASEFIGQVEVREHKITAAMASAI